MPGRTWSSVRSAGQVPSPRYFHASVAGSRDVEGCSEAGRGPRWGFEVYGNSLFLFGGYSGQARGSV